MSDNTIINSGTTGDAIRDIDKGGVKTQVMVLDLGGSGVESLLSSTNPLPVTVTNFPASQAVTGPLTDTELRASAVPVSGPLTDTQLRATAVPVSLTAASSVSVANPTTSVTITNPTTAVDATLTSAGSTRVIGVVAQGTGGSSATPWWTELVGGSSANIVGSVALVAGSTGNVIGAVAVSSGAVLGAGSTSNVIGAVAVSSGVVLGAGSSGNVLGAVAVSSGVVLGAGSSSNIIGSVANAAGSTGTMIGAVAVSSGVVLGAGSSGNVVGAVAVSSGVVLGAGSSANTIGNFAQGPGSTANYWTINSIPFSSGGVARTSVGTTVDTQIIAANSARKALVIANGSTTQTVAIGLTTQAMTTALGNVSMYLQPTSQLRFMDGGDVPLYTGPVRGINITSTSVGGGVFVSEFS